MEELHDDEKILVFDSRYLDLSALGYRKVQDRYKVLYKAPIIGLVVSFALMIASALIDTFN